MSPRTKPKTIRILITTTLFIFILLIYALSPTTPYTSALQNLLLLRPCMRLPSTSTSTTNTTVNHAHASSKRATLAAEPDLCVPMTRVGTHKPGSARNGAALRTVVVVPVGGMQCVVM